MKIKLDPVVLDQGQKTLHIPITIFTPDDYEKDLALTELTVQAGGQVKMLLGTQLTMHDGSPIKEKLPLAKEEANHVLLSIPAFPMDRIFAEKHPSLFLQFKFERDRRDELDILVKASMQQYTTHDQDVRIEFPKVRQTISPRLMTSLVLLLLTFLLLIYWDSLHLNVNNQIPFFNNKLISGGIVAVFFYLIGFNQSALRSFFKSLANLINFVQSIELYIDATLANFYKKGVGVFFSLMLFIGALFLVSFFLPVNLEAPSTKEVSTYLEEDSRFIKLNKEDKIYWKDWEHIHLGVSHRDTIPAASFCSVGGMSAFPYLDRFIFPTLPLFYQTYEIDREVFAYRGCTTEQALSSLEILEKKHENTCLAAIFRCFQTGNIQNDQEGVQIVGNQVKYIKTPYVRITARILQNAHKNVLSGFPEPNLPVPSDEFIEAYQQYLNKEAKDSSQLYQVAGLEKTTIEFLKGLYDQQFLAPEKEITRKNYAQYSNQYLGVFHFYLALIQKDNDVNLSLAEVKNMCAQFRALMKKTELRAIWEDHLAFLVKFYSQLSAIDPQARPLAYSKIMAEVEQCFADCLDILIKPNESFTYKSERFEQFVITPLTERVQANSLQLHPATSFIFRASLLKQLEQAIAQKEVCTPHIFDMLTSSFILAEQLDTPENSYRTAYEYMDLFNVKLIQYQTDPVLEKARGRCFTPSYYLLDRLSKNLIHATPAQLEIIRKYELIKYDPIKRPSEKDILEGYTRRTNQDIKNLIQDFLTQKYEEAANAPIGPEPPTPEVEN